MNKEKLREKVLRGGKELYLSAQEYEKMSGKEKQLIKEVLKEEKFDTDEYERKMKKLWPRVFKPKPLTWRKR